MTGLRARKSTQCLYLGLPSRDHFWTAIAGSLQREELGSMMSFTWVSISYLSAWWSPNAFCITGFDPVFHQISSIFRSVSNTRLCLIKTGFITHLSSRDKWAILSVKYSWNADSTFAIVSMRLCSPRYSSGESSSLIATISSSDVAWAMPKTVAFGSSISSWEKFAITVCTYACDVGCVSSLCVPRVYCVRGFVTVRANTRATNKPWNGSWAGSTQTSWDLSQGCEVSSFPALYASL
jgi:hypothetical protein